MRAALGCLAGLALLMTIGCAICGQPKSEAIYQRAAELSRVTSILEACLQDPSGPPPGLANRELVASCLNRADSSDLLINFQGDVMLTKTWQGHAVLLVCDPRGRTALWEDAGCTSRFEVHHWQAQQGQPCAFTLDPAVVCRSEP